VNQVPSLARSKSLDIDAASDDGREQNCLATGQEIRPDMGDLAFLEAAQWLWHTAHVGYLLEY
jgi:hypothetical protein